MKRLNLMKHVGIALLTVITAFSCSNDDDNSGGNTTSSTFLFASNNANGNVTYYDVTNTANITTTSLITLSTAADGIYYDSSTDAVIQASRSGLGLEGFTDISNVVSGGAITVDIIGSTDMQSPRELAVNGNFYVVADNADVDGDTNTPDGRLFIYSRNGASFTLRNTITTNFKLWGITFNGNDLYAVVDATNELAVFSNFLSNTTDATLAASKRIAIEGIVRTHGITYDASSNTLVMTDIGDAANSQDDGGFHIIENFTSKLNATANAGTLAISEQIRVAGAATLLGNPVDVAYDASTQTVFIAEAGNGGGRILAFNSIGTGGDLSPFINRSLASASSVYLYKQ